jgi:hypothetical protein
MNYDHCGIAYASSEELCELLYRRPDADITKVYVTDPYKFNDAVNSLYPPFDKLKLYNLGGLDIVKFDEIMQANWHMPNEYKELDIAQWLLDQCQTQDELQRVGQELLLYQERDLFTLLKQLKYVVDTWRKHNIVWGVGRGSSVASYVLYLIGVHKINSIYYDLDITEFLR